MSRKSYMCGPFEKGALWNWCMSHCSGEVDVSREGLVDIDLSSCTDVSRVVQCSQDREGETRSWWQKGSCPTHYESRSGHQVWTGFICARRK